MSKRRTHSPEFKARVAMKGISDRKTIQEIAANHSINPIQVSQWKRQLLDGDSELFTRGKKTQVKTRDRPKRLRCSSKSADWRWSWSGSKYSLSCSDAHELCLLADHDHPELSVSHQYALLGLPRSALYYWPTPVRTSKLRIMARIVARYLEDPCSGSCRMVGLPGQ